MYRYGVLALLIPTLAFADCTKESIDSGHAQTIVIQCGDVSTTVRTSSKGATVIYCTKEGQGEQKCIKVERDE